MSEPKMYRDASNRLFVSTNDVSMNEYPAICAELAAALRLIPCGERVADTVSVIFRDYYRDQQLVEMAWDNWMGFAATAKTAESEPLVQEVANWIVDKFDRSKSSTLPARNQTD